jgi:hypothetical protein
MKTSRKQKVQDLWRQRHLGKVQGEFTAGFPAHGVSLVPFDKWFGTFRDGRPGGEVQM